MKRPALGAGTPTGTTSTHIPCCMASARLVCVRTPWHGRGRGRAAGIFLSPSPLRPPPQRNNPSPPPHAHAQMAGFVGSSPPHALLKALRDRFDATASPRNLGLMFIASVGNSKGVGTDLLAVEGLVGYVLYGWIGSCPALARMVMENKVAAHNLPLGVGARAVSCMPCQSGGRGRVRGLGSASFSRGERRGVAHPMRTPRRAAVSHMYRDIAGKKVGPITRTGLGTFVDPREKVPRFAGGLRFCF